MGYMGNETVLGELWELNQASSPMVGMGIGEGERLLSGRSVNGGGVTWALHLPFKQEMWG